MGTDSNNNNNNSNNNASNRQNRNNKDKKPKFNRRNDKKSSGDKAKFKGKCKDLEVVIFDANQYNQADEYIKAVNEIAEYIGSNFENGSDVQQLIVSGVRVSREVSWQYWWIYLEERDRLLRPKESTTR